MSAPDRNVNSQTEQMHQTVPRIIVACPACRAHLRLKTKHVGQVIVCKQCGNRGRVGHTPSGPLWEQAPKPGPGAARNADAHLLLWAATILGLLASAFGLLKTAKTDVSPGVVGLLAFLAVFCPIMLFTSSRTLCSARVAGFIGTRNPWIARATCFIASLFAWLGLFFLFFVEG
jgi:hypothetical protein